MKKVVNHYSINKLFWVFIIGSFIGALIEILWVYFVDHKFMSRSSLLYGQFSVIWGFGCVILTLLFRKMQNRSNSIIFLIGTIVGGVYEYACSFLSEKVFGVVFWDYRHIPFNIHGRVNLMFCFFWGLISVVWVRYLYPALSHAIDMIPTHLGKTFSNAIIIFLIFDMLLSASSLIRASQRKRNIPADNAVERYLDQKYTDEYLSHRYQNMKTY